MSLRTLALALAGLTLTACAKKAAEGTMAPEAEAPADAGPGDIDALEAQLAAREDQLRALVPAAPGAGEAAIAGGAATRRDQAGGDVGASEAEMKSAEAQAPARQSAPTVAPAEPIAGPANRCESVCDLTVSICQLRDNICGLAPRHADEPRYQRACDRAAVDCSFATEACDACA